jgi:hypothetical protein
MEARFPTTSFPFRFFTTVLGLIFVNTFRAHIKFNSGASDNFKPIMQELFYDLMHNKIDGAPSPGGASSSAPAAAPPSTPTPPVYHGVPTLSPGGPGAPSARPQDHVAVPIRTFFTGGKYTQQRCGYCRAATTYCCGVCSSKAGIVALHPAETLVQGSNPPRYKQHSCLSSHRADPEGSHITRSVVGASGGKRKASAAE